MAALDAADLSGVQVRLEGQSFLGQFLPNTRLSDREAQRFMSLIGLRRSRRHVATMQHREDSTDLVCWYIYQFGLCTRLLKRAGKTKPRAHASRGATGAFTTQFSS